SMASRPIWTVSSIACHPLSLGRVDVLTHTVNPRCLLSSAESRRAVGHFVARVDDIVELAPQDHDEQGRTQEPEPERRGDPEGPREEAADRRPDHEAAHDRDTVDAADTPEKLIRDSPLAHDRRRRAPHELVR